MATDSHREFISLQVKDLDLLKNDPACSPPSFCLHSAVSGPRKSGFRKTIKCFVGTCDA